MVYCSFETKFVQSRSRKCNKTLEPLKRCRPHLHFNFFQSRNGVFPVKPINSTKIRCSVEEIQSVQVGKGATSVPPRTMALLGAVVYPVVIIVVVCGKLCPIQISQGILCKTSKQKFRKSKRDSAITVTVKILLFKIHISNFFFFIYRYCTDSYK